MKASNNTVGEGDGQRVKRAKSSTHSDDDIENNTENVRNVRTASVQQEKEKWNIMKNAP